MKKPDNCEKLKSINTDLVTGINRLIDVLESLNGYDFTISEDVDPALEFAKSVVKRATED
jgi:hypothetical protein